VTTEIEQVEDKIITAVKTTIGIADCDTWQGGDLEEMLAAVLSPIAVRVIYAGGKHGEKKVIGVNRSDRDMTFRLALVVSNLRSPKDGSRGAYAYIESMLTTFRGFSLTPLAGYLWPISDELLLIRTGRFVYGFEFERRTTG
jgi:hypothetical protein